jgi:hypothetical protein
MAEIFLIISFICWLFTTIIFMATIAPPRDAADIALAKVFGSICVTSLGIFFWSLLAISNYTATPVVVERSIVELRNCYYIPFYLDENDHPVEIKGDARLANPETTVVLIKIIPGGWKYGLHVPDRRTVEFVKKVPVPVAVEGAEK